MKKIIFLGIFLIILGCKKGKEETSEAHANYTIPPKIEVHIKDKVSIIEITNNINISYDGKKYIGTIVDDKTNYKDDTGKIVFEVNYDNDGDFKLKDENGNLIWKIRQKPGKYKISNNEDGTDPIEIKKKDDSTLKLEKNDIEIGKVKLDSKKLTLENSTDSYIETDTLIIAYGFLFLPDLTDLQKLILIAEGVHIQ